MVGSGFDWNQPYSCVEWADEFGITYPLLDDSNTGIYSLFGAGYIPHNVVIDGDGLVIYSAAGHNTNGITAAINEALSYLIVDADQDGIMDDVDNCPDVHNVQQEDIDGDGDGDLCDSCNNLIWVGGDVDGNSALDIFDILLLVDIILGETNTYICAEEAGDITQDGNINIMDVIGLIQIVIGGNEQQAISFLEETLTPTQFAKIMSDTPTDYLVSDKILIWPNPSNSSVNINGSGHTEIYNILGRKVKEINLSGTYIWNTKQLPSGVYNVLNNKKSTKITLLK